MPVIATNNHSRNVETMAARNGNVQRAQPADNASPKRSFQLVISLRNADTGEPVCFKQDGQRFGTSLAQQKTLKLRSDTRYKCSIKCTPPVVEFHLHLAGSDLELIAEHMNSNPGEYTALWNTTGLAPSKKGTRQDLLFILTGPAGSLRKKIQTKIYPPGDSHAEWGHKMDSLMWQCDTGDGTGIINVTTEQIL